MIVLNIQYCLSTNNALYQTSSPCSPYLTSLALSLSIVHLLANTLQVYEYLNKETVSEACVELVS